MEHNDFNGAKISEDLTPISKAFDRLERNIHDLELGVTELADKIKPVLGPDYPQTSPEESTEPDVSNVARLVENQGDRIAALCKYVSTILIRVEL